MVGFYSGDPTDSQTLDRMGLDAVPSSPDDADSAGVAAGFAGSLLPRVARSVYRSMADNPMPVEGGQPIEAPALLSPEDANKQFGIGGGVLSFDKPISAAAAQDIYNAKHATMMRQDAIERSGRGGVMQGVASMMGGLLDPTNLALGLIPGMGEARVAEALGGGLLARTAGRAVQGATGGALGMAATEPLSYVLDQQEHNDWTMSEALRNIAFGSLLGGGLHVIGGAIGERAAAARERANSVTERVETVGQEGRETLLQGALAQHVDGRPVEVAPALDAMETGRAAEIARRDPVLSEWTQARDQTEMRLADRQAELEQFHAAREARSRGEAPLLLADYQTPAAVDAAIRTREAAVDALSGRLAVLEQGLTSVRGGSDPGYRLRYDDPELNRPAGVDAPGGMPQTLLSRIRQMGGLQDSAGELAARDLHKTPGLVRSTGMKLDDAATRLAGDGYLPELQRDMAGDGPEQVDRIGALLDAIDEQRSGRVRLRDDEQTVWDAMVARHETAMGNLREAAEHLGITEGEARGMSRGQLRDVLDRRGKLRDAQADLDDLDEMPWFDDGPHVKSVDELQAEAHDAMDRATSDFGTWDDPFDIVADRAVTTQIEEAPKVETRGDKQLVEAQAAADRVMQQVQTEAAAGRLRPEAMQSIDDAALLADGDAKAHEAAAACLVARSI